MAATRRETMNRFAMFLAGSLLVLFAARPIFAQERPVSREEMEAMRIKVEGLEKALESPAVPAVENEDERPWCEKLDFAIGATGALQGSSGVKEQPGSKGDTTEGTVALDLELTVPISPNGKFFTLIEAGAGEGLDGRLPTLWGLNGACDSDEHLRLSEMWYEHRLFGQRLALKIGKLDLNAPSGWHESAFDANAVANDEHTQFLSGGFVNNLATEFPVDYSFGATLWASPHELWDIGIGAAESDADFDDVLQGLFSIVEVDFKPKIGNRQGHYRIYAWHNGTDHQDLRNPAGQHAHNQGFGLSFDQEITELVTLFGRYGSQRARVSQVGGAWSAGLQLLGKGFGREDDVLGLACGTAIVSTAWREFQMAGGQDPRDEHRAEIYYSWKVNGHLAVTPDIQWVRNPNGDGEAGGAWAFAIRAHLTF
jgi:carbohydrate-selective porin OprB